MKPSIELLNIFITWVHLRQGHSEWRKLDTTLHGIKWNFHLLINQLMITTVNILWINWMAWAYLGWVISGGPSPRERPWLASPTMRWSVWSSTIVSETTTMIVTWLSQSWRLVACQLSSLKSQWTCITTVSTAVSTQLWLIITMRWWITATASSTTIRTIMVSSWTTLLTGIVSRVMS